MPIVGLPDGREVEFPDGTPTDVMERAMRDFIGGSQACQIPLIRANPAGKIFAGLEIFPAVPRLPPSARCCAGSRAARPSASRTR